MQDDLEVTGISRSGRVRKKSSKLMDFESPDDIEARFRRTPMKTYGGTFRQEEPQEFQDNAPPRPVEEAGTASGSESDYYENNGENVDSPTEDNIALASHSMESDSSGSDDASARPAGVANSLYMMEKSTKKKLIVKDGRVVGRAKAQRKDKGKTRITAYMMWAKEARNELLRKHPDMDFSAISKRLGEMWSNVNYNERYLWKRKAKRFAMQKEQSNQVASNKIISNPAARTPTGAGPGRPRSVATSRATNAPNAHGALLPVSSAGGAGPLAGSAGAVGAAGAGGASGAAGGAGVYRVAGCGAADVAAHLRLLGESLAIIGERLKEHEGQIAVSGSVSVLLDTLLCSLAPLLSVCRAVPAIAPPARLLQDTLHNIAYIMPGL